MELSLNENQLRTVNSKLTYLADVIQALTTTSATPLVLVEDAVLRDKKTQFTKNYPGIKADFLGYRTYTLKLIKLVQEGARNLATEEGVLILDYYSQRFGSVYKILLPNLLQHLANCGCQVNSYVALNVDAGFFTPDGLPASLFCGNNFRYNLASVPRSKNQLSYLQYSLVSADTKVNPLTLASQTKNLALNEAGLCEYFSCVTTAGLLPVFSPLDSYVDEMQTLGYLQLLDERYSLTSSGINFIRSRVTPDKYREVSDAQHLGTDHSLALYLAQAISKFDPIEFEDDQQDELNEAGLAAEFETSPLVQLIRILLEYGSASAENDQCTEEGDGLTNTILLEFNSLLSTHARLYEPIDLSSFIGVSGERITALLSVLQTLSKYTAKIVQIGNSKAYRICSELDCMTDQALVCFRSHLVERNSRYTLVNGAYVFNQI